MSCPAARNADCRAFSLIELLVVLAILVLLVAILLPVVTRVRAASRSTKCLANLQQWGQAYQAYLNTNRGAAISEVPEASHLRWWEVLAGYNADVRQSLLCPDARDPELGSKPPNPNGTWIARGSATGAWQCASVFANLASARPAAGPDYLGSYAMNVWTFHHGSGKTPNPYIHFPPRNPDHIPLLGDNIFPYSVPGTRDLVPRNLHAPDKGLGGGLGGYCIDRHQMAVNLVFLDGHAEHVPLAGLWQLRWSENSLSQNVTVPRP